MSNRAVCRMFIVLSVILGIVALVFLIVDNITGVAYSFAAATLCLYCVSAMQPWRRKR